MEFRLVLVFPNGERHDFGDIEELMAKEGGYPDFIEIESENESQTYKTDF